MEDKDNLFDVSPDYASETQESPKKRFSEEFEEERSHWKDRVLDMASRVNKLDEMAGLQVDLYSSRQIIIERISKLYQYLAAYGSAYKSRKKDLFIKYTVDSDIKLGQGEKIIMVEGDLAELQERINLIEHHIDYYKETIRNLDSMLYGVRNKLQIEQFLSGK
jgi:hypothetical protein